MPRASLAGFVLAAGAGTRIAALSRLRAKPLLPVGSTTPFARAVSALRAAGAGQVVANAAHRAEDLVVAGHACDVDVHVEPGGPFGTAGGLAGVRAMLDDAERVAIWNGDVVADVDLGALLAAMDQEREACAALAVRRLGARGTGNVGLDEGGRVVRLRGESFGDEAHGAEFAAVHVLDRRVVGRAPSRGCLVGDVYLPLLAEGANVRAVACVGRWHDVGDLRSYLAANVDLLDGAAAMVGDGALVDPAISLASTVIGAGARVEGYGDLREIVVWPGCVARAPRSRAIVVEGGLVVPIDSA